MDLKFASLATLRTLPIFLLGLPLIYVSGMIFKSGMEQAY